MFELIDSKFTRKRFEELGFKLTDFQKATLIWNKPYITRAERLSALSELVTQTEDNMLKTQINERMEYEEKAMEQFKTASYGEMLYIVLDDKNDCPCGYFGKYDTALSYAQSYTRKEKAGCSIGKHKIINSDTIPKVKTNIRMNPNIIDKKCEELVEYHGDAVAYLRLDENANIKCLWSNELDIEEDKKVDEYRKDRFEYQFLALPYVHSAGLPVKYLPTGEYGIVGTTVDEWNHLLDRVNNGLYADFSDTSITVHFLSEKGFWYHEHLNPIYLEVEKPEMDRDNEKQYAFARAINELSSYTSSKKSEAQEKLVFKLTREYAAISENLTFVEKRVKNATRLSDILW